MGFAGWEGVGGVETGGRGGRRSVPFYRLPINTPVPMLSAAVYGVSGRVSGVFATKKV